MNKLFFNGCSITLGAELGEHKAFFDEAKTEPYMNTDFVYRHNHRYSTLVADKLGMEPINIARGGGSNWRTWRTTLDWFDSHPDFDGAAIIQMSGMERFQVPASEYVIDNVDLSGKKMNIGIVNLLMGGMYDPMRDHTIPVEEYTHWNIGALSNLWEEGHAIHNHYKNLRDDIMSWRKLGSSLWSVMDYLRHCQTMIHYFRSKNIPCYIWDGMANIRAAVETIAALKFISEPESLDELHEQLLLPNNFSQITVLFRQPDEFWEMSKETKDSYFTMIRESKMYYRIYTKWNELKEMPEFSRHDWSDMYMNPKHPKFVGCKPQRHPDEKCHAALAEAFVKEIEEKKLW